MGLLMLVAAPWLAQWYQLPRSFLYFMGGVNLAYAAFSFSLALRGHRPRALIAVLVIANLIWGMLCFRWAFLYRDSASLLGVAHLLAEGLFVGGLGGLEWRWRELLLRRPNGGGDD